ncbi:MAG: hypothetical protein JEZ12_13145 [Desulfobacterium sp.]|nr:hypothetical protein [Desulfobacterium sp.]
MSRIRIVRDKHIQGTEQARHDWADVTGQDIQLKQSIYLDTETDRAYSHIAGAMIYPGIEPGCLMVMGIQPGPKLDVLEYQEHGAVLDLIKAMVEIRYEWGYGKAKRVLQQWIGDPDRYQPVVAKVSQALEAKGGYDRGLYIREPADFQEQYAFPLYMRQLHAALNEKVLHLNGQKDLISRLQAFQPDMAEKGKLYDFPAVGLLGAFTHTMMVETPWQEDMSYGEPINLES